mgnify:CR=1 FL=1
MKNMDQNNDILTGDELSEEGDSGGDGFVGDELSEEGDSGNEEFVGDELSEDDNFGEKTHASPEMVSPLSMSPGKSERKKPIRKWMWPMGVMTMVFIVGIGVFVLIQHMGGSDRITEQALLTVNVAVPPKNEIWLKDFLIPLKSEHLYTCVAFSVVIQSWDKGLLQSQPHEKQWIRGVLYDIILEKVWIEKETPSLEKFKKWMIQAVNHGLPASQIDAVEIHHFMLL